MGATNPEGTRDTRSSQEHCTSGQIWGDLNYHFSCHTHTNQVLVAFPSDY